MTLDGADETANLAVSRLNDFLRYTLDSDPMKRVTLGGEYCHDAINLNRSIADARAVRLFPLRG